MTVQAPDRARVDFRTTRDVKALVEQAAAASGLTLSDFIVSTMIDRSNEVLCSHQVRVLSARDQDRLAALLDAPPEPNAALQRAAQRLRAAVADGSLKP